MEGKGLRSTASFTVLLVVALALLFTFNYMSKSAKNNELSVNKNSINMENKSVNGVILKTNVGIIEIDFFQDLAPKTVNNFIKLTEEGFYNGTKFHRIIPNFMIQGGDPLSKDDLAKAMWGTGGPGYTFADEIHKENFNSIGTISMANAGPNTNGSQFFINVADNNFLDTKHTVFGKVTKGMDIVMGISQVETEDNDRPVTPIVIEQISTK